MTRKYWIFLNIWAINAFTSSGYIGKDGVSFRTKSSILKYKYAVTESTIETIINTGFSTSTCGSEILRITSKDLALKDYYSLALTSSGQLLFQYRLYGSGFNTVIQAPVEGPFCDGKRHDVIVRRDARKVSFQVDGGVTQKLENGRMLIVTFSKPDVIVLGGSGKRKFYGCVYNATVEMQWTGMSATTVDILQLLDARDPMVSSEDVIVGGCVKPYAECLPLRSHLTLSDGNGSIASPHINQRFNNLSACVWVIEVPQGYRVKLRMRFMRVNDSSLCTSRYVEVLEGKEGEASVISRYCSVRFIPHEPIYSTGPHLTVRLQTEDSEALVFTASYSTASLSEGPCPAQADLTSAHGTFSSPDFPYSYGTNRACSWIITVPSDKHILITFRPDDFSIAGCHGNCMCDYLELREVDDGRRNAYGRYCGDIAPSPIYYPGHKVSLGFYSNGVESRKGFNATYEAIEPITDQCPEHKVLAATGGVIRSPRFPLPFPGQMDCLWEIRGDPGSRVEFMFSDPLYLDMACTDYIELSDGKDKDSRTFVKKYCISDDIPPPFVSKNHKLFVRFVSDRYRVLTGQMAGFVATYVIRRPAKAKEISGAFYTVAFFL
ncbi:dorsal-ventral patterning tolloid-like protein 1 isoform X2 [Nematostella vectensis]|uniref:dorsal-ventral patterning tolloid-like protein 1 isoform X2 n=1 Tax=Nematostella vectensis TaxID=45351 RepID=UPI002077568D|nr:dorsal-ventral patterning tolloid-like protein 1 isoform X2 [Nematostella vectensis]